MTICFSLPNVLLKLTIPQNDDLVVPTEPDEQSTSKHVLESRSDHGLIDS